MYDLLTKNINHEIQLLYKKIVSNNYESFFEEHLIKKFDENFIFEIFFRDFFINNKYNDVNIKRQLASEIIDTIIYNKGNITLMEIIEIINYKEKTMNINKEIKIEKFFDIEVNNIKMEMDSDYIAKINKINIKNNEFDNLENVEESDKKNEQQNDNKKKKNGLFKRTN